MASRPDATAPAARGPETAPGRVHDVAAFLRQCLKAPATPLPSSRHMVERLLEDVPWERIGHFVEFGPGTGQVTAHILDRLRPDACLYAIDSEAGSASDLRARFDDDRLVPLWGSAAQVTSLLARRGVRRVDCILSGIPFSALPDAEARAIICQSARLLGPDGDFLAYQMRRSILPHLRACFRLVERRTAWLNLPPCHLFTASEPRPCVS